MAEPRRVVVCGSRTWADAATIDAAIRDLPPHSVIIHGGAHGADAWADCAARQYGLPVQVFPAEWRRYGRGAGPRRNRRMLEEGAPDTVWAFRCRGSSPGTDDMVRQALQWRANGHPELEVLLWHEDAPPPARCAALDVQRPDRPEHQQQDEHERGGAPAPIAPPLPRAGDATEEHQDQQEDDEQG